MSNYLHSGTPEYSLDWAMAYSVQADSVLWVDGDSGSNQKDGRSPKKAMNSIQYALDRTEPGGTVFVLPRTITALQTDPISYAETLIIDNYQSNISLIGISANRTQGGLPQIKIGAGTTAMIDVRAPGVRIANIGINGADSTGGGILLRDDGGTTYSCFGALIEDCHFKNCKGHTTNGTLGGAIYTTTDGGMWQTMIRNNIFYKNVAGIVMRGTSSAIPQDLVIENNVFSSYVKTDTDVDIYIAADGVKGLVIRKNTFATMDVPTKGSGSVQRYIYLGAGCNGIVSGNEFACYVPESGSEVTFGATGTACVIPTTVKLAGNWGETDTSAAANTLDGGWVWRT